MPKNKNALTRYKVINKMLANGRTASKIELAEACSKVLDNTSISHRTIENDIHAMRYDEGLRYFAPIEYDAARRAYFYNEEGFSIDHLPLGSDDVRKLRLAAKLLKQYEEIGTFGEFSGTIEKVVRLINYSKLASEKKAMDFIEFEKNPTTSGMEFIDPLVRFIQKKQVIKIRHHAFWRDQTMEFTVHPFYLKEYRERWYLVGYCEERDDIRIFGLEGIRDIEAMPMKTFTFKHFNPETFFEKFIGISVPENAPEEIILRFKNDVGKFIETQPLHPSQKLIAHTARTYDFSYFLATNNEFMGIVLNWQEHVEVLSPKGFRKQIISVIGKMGEQYEEGK